MPFGLEALPDADDVPLSTAPDAGEVNATEGAVEHRLQLLGAGLPAEAGIALPTTTIEIASGTTVIE
jgi:hypothetical protein